MRFRITSAAQWTLASAIGLLVGAPGCILEDNPAFGATDGATGGATDSQGSSFTDTAATDSAPSEGTLTASTGGDPTTATGTSPTDGTETTGSAGCDDPRCEVYHVGPTELACDREEDGAFVETCDFFGEWAIKVAVAAAGYAGGGRVLLHDDHGSRAVYRGGIDFDSNTFLGPFEDTPRENLIIDYAGDAVGNAIRMQGNDNHIRDVTISCRAGCEHALQFRSDPDTEDTETSGHLIERVVVAVGEPEIVGGNSITTPLSGVGPNTVIRHNYIWGFFELPIDLRNGDGTKIHHNTWALYQDSGMSQSPNYFFDVRDTQGIEIANNVVLSLTDAVDTLMIGTDATIDGVFSGNILEGIDAEVIGIPPGDPQNVIADNVIGNAPLESPYDPRLLNDAPNNADLVNATIEGVSLDGVDLAAAAEVVPGAFQARSEASLPRRTVTRLGPMGSDCGGNGCDVTDDVESDTQIAIWRTWPGGTLEIFPGTYGGAVSSWPIEILGMGAQPDEVVLRRQPEGLLALLDVMDEPEVFRILFRQPTGSHITNLTFSVAPDQDGLVVEGSNDPSQAPGTIHLLERIRVVDEGDTATDLAERPFWLGSNVVLRNSLVMGGFETCIRFGVRRYESHDTPPTTSVVHNFSCRLTQVVAGEGQQAFEVASVMDLLMVNLAVELTDGGPLFKAQRQTSSGDDGAIAFNPPQSFTVHSASVLGVGATYDGFTDAEGTYQLDFVDILDAGDPLFLSPTDSHLDPLATTALDNGVDPSTLDATLQPGIALDGVDRSLSAAIDRGAYEEGL